MSNKGYLWRCVEGGPPTLKHCIDKTDAWGIGTPYTGHWMSGGWTAITATLAFIQWNSNGQQSSCWLQSFLLFHSAFMCTLPQSLCLVHFYHIAFNFAVLYCIAFNLAVLYCIAFNLLVCAINSSCICILAHIVAIVLLEAWLTASLQFTGTAWSPL